MVSYPLAFVSDFVALAFKAGFSSDPGGLGKAQEPSDKLTVIHWPIQRTDDLHWGTALLADTETYAFSWRLAKDGSGKANG